MSAAPNPARAAPCLVSRRSARVSGASRKPDWSREKAFRIDEDGCLLYRGVLASKNDLPIIRINGKYISVRRAILAKMLGRPLTANETAASKCEKVRCCSPKCLFVMGPRERVLQAIERRHWQAEISVRRAAWANRPHRYSDADVDDMRARDAAGEPREEIAARYGNTAHNLMHIWSYRSRILHLPPEVQNAIAAQRNTTRR